MTAEEFLALKLCYHISIEAIWAHLRRDLDNPRWFAEQPTQTEDSQVKHSINIHSPEHTR